MLAAMPCKTPTYCRGGTCRSIGKHKTKYACIVDADESMIIRLEGVPHRYHEDHISATRIDSLSHYNWVHKFIPMPQAFKILDAKAAVEIMTKIGGNTGMAADKSHKKEVFEEARNKVRKVQFASFMDLCHLKNSELQPQYQKYKGRVVLRVDTVKDDSGSYAVFTEQTSSASQMTAAKVMDIIFKNTRMRGTSSRCNIRLYPGQNGRCTDVMKKKNQSQNVQTFGYVYRSTNGQNHGPVWKTQSFLLNGIWECLFFIPRKRNFLCL